MKAAIIGLPNSGKSTLFSAVTGVRHDPYLAPEPRQAAVRVPEPRFPYLIKLCQPKKVVEATMEFVDIPGCALDDAKGQEEWRRVLPVVRQADVLVVVVRAFQNAAVPAPRRGIDPAADFAAMWDELIFADLDAVTTRVHRIETALKKPTKTHDLEKRELALLTRCREALESGKPLSAVVVTEEDRRQVSSFAFLTEKTLVCLWNDSEENRHGAQEPAVEHVAASLRLNAALEADIAALDEAERPAFLAELGFEAPARDRLIQICYTAAGLISFLTMGPDEVRAWTIPRGATAVEAAAKIHTDLARGFIRAETVAYDDLVAHGDMKGARAAGKVRKEGKTYVVADGDILNILASG
ncbi:MAG: redox-regulated ATPase YchF [Planctomycetes bacterium]|nr:redox-regulated ATPase YchF [Planctomycetota bacterium]